MLTCTLITSVDGNVELSFFQIEGATLVFNVVSDKGSTQLAAITRGAMTIENLEVAMTL
jgi:hypothetical protein